MGIFFMMRLLTLALAVGLAVGLAGCDSFDYHPYDVRVDGERNINATNAAAIEHACLDATAIRFAVVSDTQGCYDETRDMVDDVNARADIDFVIHLGDLTDYGSTREFTLQRDILGKLKVPYVTCIGNHDCLGNGEETFAAIFGDVDFEFIAGRVKFVMLNTNALEYDYGRAIPNFDFIERCATSRVDAFDRTVVAMHAKPTSDVFNNNVSRLFNEETHELPQLLFCLCGHDHQQQVFDLYGDGTLYYQVANIAKRKYYIFTITADGYSYEDISF